MKNSPLQQPEDGRARLLKGIIAGLLFLLLSLNTFISITEKYSALKTIYLTIPFLIIIILSFKLRLNLILTITFLVVALYSAIDQSDHVDYSGSVFFVLSYAVNKNNKFGIGIIITSILCIALRATIFNLSVFQAFNLLIAYSAVYSFFYLIIFKKKKHNPNELNKNDYDRLLLYAQGYTNQDICDILGLGIEPKSFRDSLTKIRKDQKCTNDFQLAIKLTQLREIDPEVIEMIVQE